MQTGSQDPANNIVGFGCRAFRPTWSTWSESSTSHPTNWSNWPRRRTHNTMAPSAPVVKEKLQGVAGYVSVNKMQNNALAAVRIAVGRSCASGSCVDGRSVGLPSACILTNHHVFQTAEDAAGATVIFHYNSPDSREYIEVRCDPTRGFVSDEGIDYALVAVRAEDLSLIPCDPLEISPTARVVKGMPVTIWQHPRGGYKQVSTWVLESIHGTKLLYQNDTEPGSSGSPIFNHLYDLVGVHYAGQAGRGNWGCVLGGKDGVIVNATEQLKKRGLPLHKSPARPVPPRPTETPTPDPKVQASLAADHASRMLRNAMKGDDVEELQAAISVAAMHGLDVSSAKQQLDALRAAQRPAPRRDPPVVDVPAASTPPPRAKRTELEVTAESPLSELKAFIDEHGLDVKKNVGGTAGRTKKDIYNDIVSEMTPRTVQKPRRVSVRVHRKLDESTGPTVTVTADSSVEELKAFIDEHGLDVKKNVGGTAGRTKADMYRDIVAALEDDVSDVDMSSLSITEESPLSDLKDFIDEHELNVKKNVGGAARRTKADMYRDIVAALQAARA